MSEPISVTHPEIAAEWHPTKNGDLTPADIKFNSRQKVWWRCSKNPVHVWPTMVRQRTIMGSGCLVCAGKWIVPEESLAHHYPEIAAEWHPIKNGDLKATQVFPGSCKSAWWRCVLNTEHEWRAKIGQRTRIGTSCPECRKLYSPNKSLAISSTPGLLKEWHPTNNAGLEPDRIGASSRKSVWWRCIIDSTHEWKVQVDTRRRGGGTCPFCRVTKHTKRQTPKNTLPTLKEYSALLCSEWHPTLNLHLSPSEITIGSNSKVWWKCSENPSHVWHARIFSRTRNGSGCPKCASEISANSFAIKMSALEKYPHIVADWHPVKNKLGPTEVSHGSGKKIWWQCNKDNFHSWKSTIQSKVKSGKCPKCKENPLALAYPVIASEWHPTKNKNQSIGTISVASGHKVWWRCSENPSHEWQAVVRNRTLNQGGCPVCKHGWSVNAIRGFVGALKQHLQNFTPAELYLLFQQNGLLGNYAKRTGFVKALATGRFPFDEIKKFCNGEDSLVDRFIDDHSLTLEEAGVESGPLPSNATNASPDSQLGLFDDLEKEDGEESGLPLVQTKAVLCSLQVAAVTSADEEAVEFLISSGIGKIWRHTFRNEQEAVAQAESFAGSEYAERVRLEFLSEYRQAKAMSIPVGYSFTVKGIPAPPNLMQRLIAVRVQQKKRVGNWSGTGAGKTLSAILASRLTGSRLTVICCPNSVVAGWEDAILAAYPDSLVATKTFYPDWNQFAGDMSGFGTSADRCPRYLILNYEAYQQSDSAEKVARLVADEQVDFIVIDEVHFTKQRYVEDMSRRKQMISAMVALAAKKNPDLYVLGMSATPVINNLQEGKSLIELVTGVEHGDISTKPTLANCMQLHQKLVSLGARWMPEYDVACETLTPEIDCSEAIDEIRALGKHGSPLELEQILTRSRLPVILDHLQPKTLIYTHYIQGIDRELWKAATDAGWKVGFFTGEDKSGLDAFINGDLDVLIGSSAIGTGVDGLQQVCSRLIINVLPWTHAEFEQLKGRIYRQGQTQKVDVIIPLTNAVVNGQRWSWCDSKMQRLRFKKSIADAAVDGVVPEGHLRSSAQAYQDVIGWLNRLESGHLETIVRAPIQIPLPAVSEDESSFRLRRYGDFSNMNRKWNQGQSHKTYERLQANLEEWAQYHTLYRKAREEWTVIPYQEMIRWFQLRSDLIIGDFGCGEASLAAEISDRHTVYSFDYVAINDDVIECDMAHVPLEDGSLDAAIFSLSLMGSNFTDYLREAYRTLKLDGQLHIIEATSRFSGRDGFVSGLKKLGFAVVEVKDMWKFTHIQAIRTDNVCDKSVRISF